MFVSEWQEKSTLTYRTCREEQVSTVQPTVSTGNVKVTFPPWWGVGRIARGGGITRGGKVCLWSGHFSALSSEGDCHA